MDDTNVAGGILLIKILSLSATYNFINFLTAGDWLLSSKFTVGFLPAVLKYDFYKATY